MSVIDAGQWERVNSMISFLAKKDYSIGFKTKGQWKHVINDAVVEHSKTKHELENFMDLLIPLGLIPVGSKLSFDDLQLEYYLTREDREFMERFWAEHNLEDKTVLCFLSGRR
jgi:ADP-heptose:LPS heptosyltransferase